MPKIVIGSNYFKILEPDRFLKYILYKFNRPYIKFDPVAAKRRDKKGAVTLFATGKKDGSEFRYHRNAYKDFELFVRGFNYRYDEMPIEYEPMFTPEYVSMPMRKEFTPRDYQIPLIDYLTDENPSGQNKFIGLQTGKGKSAISMFAMSKLGVRTILMMRPVYIQKWVDELVEKMDIKEDEIMTVQGNKQLLALHEIIKARELGDNKILIFSNRTYQVWLKDYEEYGSSYKHLGYRFPPDELFKRAKAGLRIIDEVHQDFHLNFLTDLYTHTYRCISMSATLDTTDRVIRKMYALAYPIANRAPDSLYDKYIDTFAVHYWIGRGRRFRTTEWNSNNYSHIVFEKSIIKDKEFLDNYLSMIDKIVIDGYIKRKAPGQKCVIYAASIAMCNRITAYLKKQHKDLDIRRFCEDDPYENMTDPDIRVSNIIKGGTGHDVKNLITTVLTIAIASIQANLQVHGRLRKIEGVDTEFYYLVCHSIPKHMQYHTEKQEMLTPKSRKFGEIFISKEL